MNSPDHADATIRPAAITDADAVWPLTKAFATSFVPCRSAFDAGLATVLTSPRSLLLIAELEGRVVGYLLGHVHPTLFANAEVAWIEELMVDASARRHGIGAALMAAAESWAFDQGGAAYVALATRRAEPFYRAIGYEPSVTFLRKLAPTSPGSALRDARTTVRLDGDSVRAMIDDGRR